MIKHFQGLVRRPFARKAKGTPSHQASQPTFWEMLAHFIMRLAPKKAKNQCQKCLLRKAFGLFLKRVSCTCIFVFGCRCARLSFLFSLPSFILIVSSEIRLDNVRNELIRVMSVLAQCTSHLQSLPYEARLRELCNAVLAQGEDGDIEAALAHFKAQEPGGYSYEKLLAVAEDCAEAVVDERGSALLLLIPVMAWSRYRNYHGVLDEDVLEKLPTACAPTLPRTKPV